MAEKLLSNFPGGSLNDSLRIRCSPRSFDNGIAATCLAADRWIRKPQLRRDSDGHPKYKLWNRSGESGSEGHLSRQFSDHEFWPYARRREKRQVRRGGE